LKINIENPLKRNGKNKEHIQLLSTGSIAPEFSLVASNGKIINVSDLQGRPVVLVFYPADNSSVCSNQLALYNEALHLFDEHDAQLLGISVDDAASHQAFAESLKLKFPLLADDDPAGEVANKYGVLNKGDGLSDRALFVVDSEGIIHWRYVSPRKVNPGAHGILEALESLEKDAESSP